MFSLRSRGSKDIPAASTKGRKTHHLHVDGQQGRSKERQQADLLLNPNASAAATVKAFGRGTFGDTGITETFDGLNEAMAKVRADDLSGPEAMLLAQAAALNAIFTELARRSAINMGEYIAASEKYMRLALKAQAQCRATIETLAAIKNPPLVIAKQANISNGPQQVNNGTAARAEKTHNQPNELLESDHGKRLDPGAPGPTGSSDPQLVPVDALDRAA